MIEKQKLDRYEMHKYWGKKPACGLAHLIDRYSQKGDTLLDPFAGYGVFCSEAYLSGRNVIVNDLNPIACFIAQNLFEQNVDLQKLSRFWNKIKSEFLPFVAHWYILPDCEQKIMPTSILRNHEDRPLKQKYMSGRYPREQQLTNSQIENYLTFEQEQLIEDWFPNDELIPNSRISAKYGMCVSDLFTRRELACHARLYQLIKAYSTGTEQNLLLLAFTANLANCSKLVPPIMSRGEMAPGAWMTGFYRGETYIENNVLHYFENRLNKVIKGKMDYLAKLGGDLFAVAGSKNTYYISNFDAKHLDSISDETIDYIFTDPPYGDTVPYFEQSIIWNAWLGLEPDYMNEIVVSDSNARSKSFIQFEEDIFQAFSEIRRVLKKGKYFSLTYHSLSGAAWRAITNACILNGFEMVDFEWLTQKTFTPRQLNRSKSIKGDVLITFRKIEKKSILISKKNYNQHNDILQHLHNIIDGKRIDTNDVMMSIIKWIFIQRMEIGNTDVYEILKSNFSVSEDGLWYKKKLI